MTDLGSAHPTWFHKAVDACFVPSDAVREIALGCGLRPAQIRQYGLPVRENFWQASDKTSASDQTARSLGLRPDKKTVLIVGGGAARRPPPSRRPHRTSPLLSQPHRPLHPPAGDGMGALGNIVDAISKRVGEASPGDVQVVAVCGKNAALREKLQKRAAAGEWPGVEVNVMGFVKKMSELMEVADCLVTKAGPGTIAEAAIRGLPTMLSSYLPGQEVGNVPYVTENGFGEYSKDPSKIAERVSAWLQDPELLARMKSSALACAAPDATHQIAKDLCEMIDVNMATHADPVAA